MRWVFWVAAALLGVVANIAIALWVNGVSPEIVDAVLEARPLLWVVVVSVGIASAMWMNDVAARRHWGSFAEVISATRLMNVRAIAAVLDRSLWVYPVVLGVLVATSSVIVSRTDCSGAAISDDVEAMMMVRRAVKAEHLGRLTALGGSVEMLDSIVQTQQMQSCPVARYSYWIDRVQWQPRIGVNVTLHVKGSCSDCWDRIRIAGTISKCAIIGPIRIHRAQVSRGADGRLMCPPQGA